MSGVFTGERLDPEHVACVLADAFVLGDASAARKWRVSKRTVQRYRSVASKDVKLTAAVAAKNAEVQHELSTLRVAFLREALQTMREKMKDATLYEVAGAVKVVGELHHVALAVSDERPDEPDPEAAEAAGGDVGSAAH